MNSSRWNVFFIVMSVIMVIVGLGCMFVFVYNLYMIFTGNPKSDLPTHTFVIGLISYLVFKVCPGLIGIVAYIKNSFRLRQVCIIICAISLIASGIGNYVLDGLSTGMILGTIFMIVSFLSAREMRNEAGE